VAHAAWEAPDGRKALILANWTTEPRTVTIHDARLGDAVQVSASDAETVTQSSSEGSLSVTVPKLGCVLVASE